MNFFKKIILIISLVLTSTIVYSQTGASCGSAFILGTPSTVQACFALNSTTNSGSAPCAGAGYGGSGGYTYVRFCTGSVVKCINFSILQGTAGGNWAVSVYSTNCSTAMDAQCLGNNGSGATFNTASPNYNNYQPNTCYFARIWSANPGTFTLCTQVMAPPNDFCTSPTTISPVPQSLNNFCMTAGTAGDPPPAQFCAASLENNAWYSITTLTNCTFPCTVTITISGITCSGGGAGFQIGFWTGACSSLTNIGCTSGAGGTVTATITNLNPGQTVLIGLDGNAGANCTYSMSATNTQPVPLPIELMDFDVVKGSGYVALNWKTASEKNNDYFTIERTRDGAIFETVDVVDAIGNSTKEVNYRYNDKNPYFGLSYYRLKQTDYDGHSTYSQMRAIEYSGNTGVSFDVVPNPSGNDGFNIAFNIPSSEPCNITITDIAGKVVYNRDVIMTSAKLNINEGFARGIYTIAVKSLSEERPIATKKLVISE